MSAVAPRQPAADKHARFKECEPPIGSRPLRRSIPRWVECFLNPSATLSVMAQHDTLFNTALAQHRAGNLAAAEPIYRQIIEQAPGNGHAWHFLGALFLQTARPQEAVQCITKARTLLPADPEVHSHLGAAFGLLGQHAEAVESLRRAAQLSPQSGPIHYNLGTALRNAGQLNEAIDSFRRAVAANPQAAEAHYNLGNTLRELSRFAEAEQAFRAALQARPNYVKAMVNLGIVQRDQEHFAEALETLRAAVALDPSHANAPLNLATVLRDVGQFEEAATWARRALAIDPNSAEAHNCLGTLQQAQADWSAAGASYDRALQLNPELADAHYCRATHRMRLGDLSGGMAEYEWRWKCKTYSTRKFDAPRWDGNPLAGRTILLHAEQGLGDTLQFVRYAAAVSQKGGRVMLECQTPLVELLRDLPGADRIVPAGSPLPRYDVHCPLLSLPSALGLAESQWWSGPYLTARPELVTRWQDRLRELTGLRVGICWQGNAQFLFDAQRSFALERFADVAAVAGVHLISLQKGSGRQQIASASFPVLDLGPELDESTGPFLDSAAVMKNLDLVITSDTSIAHLAGGIGVPVWVALSAHCDWRWFLDRADSPWYPSMRLFRQRQLGEWEPVFQQIAAEVAKLPKTAEPAT